MKIFFFIFILLYSSMILAVTKKAKSVQAKKTQEPKVIKVPKKEKIEEKVAPREEVEEEKPLDIEYTYTGSIGGQARLLVRRDISPENWDSPTDYYFIHGNFNPKLRVEKSTFENSIFFRRADSTIYRTNTLVKEPLLFPKDLMAREAVDMTMHAESPTYRQDLIIHKLSYVYEFEKFRVEMGRFFINYGLGETFNPMNPFNLPTGLFVINDISQGSDGARTTWFFNENIDFNFYALGSKDYLDPNRSVHPTIYAQMEFRYDTFQLNVSGGLDQRRTKGGGQISYSFTDYLAFFQAFYQSELGYRQSLADMVFGLDRQVTQWWHARLEGSYQEIDHTEFISTRFLPQEYMIALAQEFEVHPLVKLRPVLTFDPESYQTYALFKVTYNATQNFDLEFYGNQYLLNRPHKETVRQKIMNGEAGIRGQYFF